MSVNCAIIAQTRPGHWEGIYCHANGYPRGVGRVLFHHYQHPVTVRVLMSLGPISSLGMRLHPIGPHSFANPERGVTVVYHRDRGEERKAAVTGISSEAVADIITLGLHRYVFDGERWFYRETPLAEMPECAAARNSSPYYDVYPMQHWRHRETGRKVEPYESEPWSGKAGWAQWDLVTEGYGVFPDTGYAPAVNRKPVQAFPAREEAWDWIKAQPAPQTSTT